MSPDTVVLEVATIYVDAEDNQLDSEIWMHASEAHLEPSRKKELWKNGFRLARLGQEIPPAIKKYVESFRDQGRLQGNPTGGDSEVGHHRRQSRAGVPNQILASSVQPEINMITEEKNYVSGRLLKDAQCVLEVTTTPKGDGSVEFQLLPEIHHGQNKPQYAGRNGIWQLLVEREKESIEKLLVHQTLVPGESIMISCTPDPMGLGKSFFAWNGKLGHKVILIRLAQVQYDALFAPQEIVDPLTNTQ